MFERFTDRARRVVVLAQEEARMLNHNYIGRGRSAGPSFPFSFRRARAPIGRRGARARNAPAFF